MADQWLALATPAMVRQALGLSQERMSRLLGCGPGTLARWERLELDPGARAWQALTTLKQIVVLVRAVSPPEGVVSFLDTARPEFGRLSAFDLISAGQAESVLSVLAADFEGLGF